MVKWMRVLISGSKRSEAQRTSNTIKKDLEAYRKWSQRKVSDRLS